MDRSLNAVAAAALVSLVAGCSVTGGVSAVRATRVAPCAARALVLRHGTAVVPMTGEHAVMYRLSNRGSVSCSVRGYPRVVLYDAKGSALPFRYADGGGAYVTAKKPVTVMLKPGVSAYVLVAKYRCDLGIVRNATTIRLTLAAANGKVFTKREAVGVSGAPGLSYCRGGQRDPGQKVAVSPIEPTGQATTSLH